MDLGIRLELKAFLVFSHLVSLKSLVMQNNFIYHTSSQFLTCSIPVVSMLFSTREVNCADPDQMALSEAFLSGYTLFSIKGKSRLGRTALNNLSVIPASRNQIRFVSYEESSQLLFSPKSITVTTFASAAVL